jgi:drug/metabolite transporter (DMT)-like permease
MCAPVEDSALTARSDSEVVKPNERERTSTIPSAVHVPTNTPEARFAITGELQLIVATALFGLIMVGQRYVVENNEDDGDDGDATSIGVLTFNALRLTFSLLSLVIVYPFLRRYSRFYSPVRASGESQERGGGLCTYVFWNWSIVIGGSYFVATWLTQESLVELSAGMSSFIVGAYVVLIPFMEWLLPVFYGSPCQCLHRTIWIGAGLCLLGMYFMSGCTLNTACFTGGRYSGELYALGAVIFWAISIMSMGLAAPQISSVDLLLGPMSVAALLSIVASLAFEIDDWVHADIYLREYALFAWGLGILNATGYFLSILGQSCVSPSRAAIIFSSGESLSACLFGYLLLGETLSTAELGGGLLMVIAACIITTANPVDSENGSCDDDETDEHSDIEEAAPLILSPSDLDRSFEYGALKQN